jgi:hypothetical protein
MLGALPPIIRLVRAETAVLLMIESKTFGKVFYGTDYEKANQAARERKFDEKHPWLGHDERARSPLFDLGKLLGAHWWPVKTLKMKARDAT